MDYMSTVQTLVLIAQTNFEQRINIIKDVAKYRPLSISTV